MKNYSTIGTHKNILEFLGNEIFDNQMYIYLEYASGGSISDIISKYEGLNPNLVRLYLKQTTEAVVHLHKCGITHNDINPSCILLNERGIIKISNFSKANTTQSNLKDIITNLINQFTLMSNRINTDELFIYLRREYGNMEDLN